MTIPKISSKAIKITIYFLIVILVMAWAVGVFGGEETRKLDGERPQIMIQSPPNQAEEPEVDEVEEIEDVHIHIHTDGDPEEVAADETTLYQIGQVVGGILAGIAGVGGIIFLILKGKSSG